MLLFGYKVMSIISSINYSKHNVRCDCVDFSKLLLVRKGSTSSDEKDILKALNVLNVDDANLSDEFISGIERLLDNSPSEITFHACDVLYNKHYFIRIDWKNKYKLKPNILLNICCYLILHNECFIISNSSHNIDLLFEYSSIDDAAITLSKLKDPRAKSYLQQALRIQTNEDTKLFLLEAIVDTCGNEASSILINEIIKSDSNYYKRNVILLAMKLEDINLIEPIRNLFEKENDLVNQVYLSMALIKYYNYDIEDYLLRKSQNNPLIGIGIGWQKGLVSINNINCLEERIKYFYWLAHAKWGDKYALCELLNTIDSIHMGMGWMMEIIMRKLPN